MSVTLETLRADFEAARDADLNSTIPDPFAYGGTGGYVPLLTKFPDYGWFEADEWAFALFASKVTANAARLYVIARDFGLEAAMLYKLSDGAIDPREVRP